MEDAKGLTPNPAVALSLSAFTVEHAVPPAAEQPRSQRWSRSIELLLAVLLNIALLVALFYRPHPQIRPLAKEPPAISVDLVPQPKPQPQPKAQQPKQEQQKKDQPKPEEKKPEEKKPEEKKPEEKKPEQKPVDKYRESGGDPNLKPGRVPKVEADKPKAPPEVKAEKPKPEAPKKPAANVPDWAKALDKGYDLPTPRDSSIDKSQGSNAQNSLSDREGEGGGDVYLNQLVAQVSSHVIYPQTAGGEVGLTVLVIVVDRSGNLQGMRQVRSSGRRDLDWAANEAVRQSAPFRPLPPDYPAPVIITLKIPVTPS